MSTNPNSVIYIGVSGEAILYDPDDDIDFPGVLQENLIKKLKQLKTIYNTDNFDMLIADGFIAYEDLGEMLIDIRILTPDDRDDVLDLIYKVHDAELEELIYDD